MNDLFKAFESFNCDYEVSDRGEKVRHAVLQVNFEGLYGHQET